MGFSKGITAPPSGVWAGNAVYNIASQTYSPLQNMAMSGLHNNNVQGLGQMMPNQSAAQAQQQLYNQMMGARNQFKPPRWMIDGKPLTFKEFCDTIYPDDCAEKTHLILKFGGKEDDN